ncbi:PepSY domain-containing protein [Acidipila sp. EB88]|uniref:PepSY-associated TM helix domain-containing protein n=1 Tax=Acidipila sp. EB88 TaxID=2305226 RepID=UPI000F5FD7AB|nr:PepSY-associated TM helix domain-containing protein [Acidipila sp. EB88]RRA48171.1 PepSY domain-containing protein [Acidipila sp. EB88]
MQRPTRQTHSSQPSWWRSPQRLWLRRAVFQVHLWLGLAVTLYAIVIGLSGSALVFKQEIERAQRPALFHITPGGQRASFDSIIQVVEHDRPGWRVSALRGFSSDEPLTLMLRPATGALSANYRSVVVQPYTGLVLADTMRFDGVLGWLSNLHFYLLAGSKGLLVSGCMSGALAVLCFTGLVLWWPGVRRWFSALLFRPHRRWKRLNYDLHTVTGFWVALPLLLLSITGFYFAFPAPVIAVMDALTFSHPAAALKRLPAHAVSGLPSQPRMLSVDQAFARATDLLPKNAPPGYLSLASPKSSVYYVTGYYVGSAPYSSLVSVSFDARSGALLSHEDTNQQPPSRRIIQYFFALHFGSFAGEGPGGVAVKFLWVLLGIAPAVLAITGVVMFVVRKGRKRPAPVAAPLSR